MKKFKNLPENHRNISGQMPCFFPVQLNQECGLWETLSLPIAKRFFRDIAKACARLQWGAEKKLSENSLFQRQLYDIFKHEFVMSIWLPEKGFLYKPSKDVYIPTGVFDNDNYCNCG